MNQSSEEITQAQLGLHYLEANRFARLNPYMHFAILINSKVLGDAEVAENAKLIFELSKNFSRSQNSDYASRRSVLPHLHKKLKHAESPTGQGKRLQKLKMAAQFRQSELNTGLASPRHKAEENQRILSLMRYRSEVSTHRMMKTSNHF